MLVGDALLRNDDPIAARNRVDHRGADTAGGGSARQHHGVASMPDHQRLQVGFMEGGCHALVDDDVADMVDLEPVVEFGPPRADLDVLKRIRRIGARPPYAAILAGLHVGNVSPNDRNPVDAAEICEFVHVIELLRDPSRMN